MQSLEKDPANRMASAEEFSDLLAPYRGTGDGREEVARRLATAQGADASSEYPEPGGTGKKPRKLSSG